MNITAEKTEKYTRAPAAPPQALLFYSRSLLCVVVSLCAESPRGKPFRMFRDRTDILFGTLQARRGEIVLRSPRVLTRAAPRSLRQPSVLGAITLPAVPRPQTVKAVQLFICPAGAARLFLLFHASAPP